MKLMSLEDSYIPSPTNASEQQQNRGHGFIHDLLSGFVAEESLENATKLIQIPTFDRLFDEQNSLCDL